MMIGLILLLITVGVYRGSKTVYAIHQRIYLSPLLVVPTILIAILLLFGISYPDYQTGGQWLTRLLGPATVAMAVPLHKNFDLLLKHKAAILTGVASGAVLAVLSSAGLALMFGLSREIVLSIAPRSVTTPIAINIAEMVGGNETLAAVFVIMTGLIGIVIGPLLISRLRIESSVAKGLLLGMGAHGCGISKALELGEEEGAIASLAMIITAGSTLFIAPVFLSLIK